MACHAADARAMLRYVITLDYVFAMLLMPIRYAIIDLLRYDTRDA